MFLFQRLLLAHFLGDFPLQFTRIYNLKVKGIPGTILHSGIQVLTMLFLSFPFLDRLPVWLFIFFVGFTHTLIDRTKVLHIDRVPGGGNIWTFLLDQCLHIGTLSLLFLIPSLRSLGPPAEGGSFLIALYDNDNAVRILTGFIISTFGGVFFIDFLKKTYFSAQTANEPLTVFGKWYGILERGVATAAVLLGGPFYVLFPLAALVRIPVAGGRQKRFKAENSLLSYRDAIASFSIALVVGMVLRLLT